MKIYFDKTLETERVLELERVTERPLQNHLSGSWSGAAKDGIPDVSSFTSPDFDTLIVESDEGESIPLVGNYSRITDLQLTLEDEGRACHLSIAVE